MEGLVVGAELFGKGRRHRLELSARLDELCLDLIHLRRHRTLLVVLAAHQQQRQPIHPLIEFITELSEVSDALPSHSLSQADVDLRRELRHHQRGPPPEATLAADDVREHVVPHIHDLFARGHSILHQVVQMHPVPTLEDLSGLERCGGRVEKSIVHVAQAPILGVHSEESQVRVFQEGRLARSHDDDVEEVKPLERPVLLAGVAVNVVHDRVGVVPETVGQQKHLASGQFEALEEVDDARLRLDVQARVLRNLVFDDSVTMAQVDAAADVLVDLIVRLVLQLRVLVLVVVHKGHELRVHKRIRERKERVDVSKVAGGKVLVLHLAVRLDALGLVQRPRSMECNLDVHVAVHFDDVATLLVNHQPALVHRRVVVRELQNLRRVVHEMDQLLHGAAMGEDLKRLGNVLRQRVVHVEPNRTDTLHVQSSVAENLALVLLVGPVVHSTTSL
mmetsp:Transcript_9815/g.23350  ORF Transcript_9815/g.23350 Transcript_9815/m.23350 type:complete len:448 (+) Transcript_9815:556-1899(+)